MKEQIRERFLVVVPECAKEKIAAILEAIGIQADATCLSGEEALREAEGSHVVVLTLWKLPDMTGEELTQKLGSNADVLMVVPNDYEEESGCGALLLRNPMSQEALLQAIRATRHCQKKMMELEKKVHKLERLLEERKIIDKAKGRLIDQLHMSESQAHYHIQKKSMDSGRRIVDVAREILEAETIAVQE